MLTRGVLFAAPAGGADAMEERSDAMPNDLEQRMDARGKSLDHRLPVRRAWRYASITARLPHAHPPTECSCSPPQRRRMKPHYCLATADARVRGSQGVQGDRRDGTVVLDSSSLSLPASPCAHAPLACQTVPAGSNSAVARAGARQPKPHTTSGPSRRGSIPNACSISTSLIAEVTNAPHCACVAHR